MERIRISKSNAVPLLHVIPLISLVKDQVSNLNSRRRLFMQTNSCRTFCSKKVSIRSSIQIKDYLWHQLQVTPLLKRKPAPPLRGLKSSQIASLACSNCSTCSTCQWFAPRRIGLTHGIWHKNTLPGLWVAQGSGRFSTLGWVPYGIPRKTYLQT